MDEPHKLSIYLPLTGYCTLTEHITPVIKSLHWLKIEERIHYKIISLAYDSLHTSHPIPQKTYQY